MSWHSFVREAIRRETAAWKAEAQRFERLVTRAAGSPAPATQEIEDVAEEMAKHAETLVVSIRDLAKARRLDKEKRLERSRQ